MSNTGNGHPATAAGRMKRMARGTMGLSRSNGGSTAKGDGADARRDTGRALTGSTSAASTAQAATGEALRALTPHRSLSMLTAGAPGSANGKPAPAAATPNGGPPPPAAGQGPFGNLWAGSGQTLIDAALDLQEKEAARRAAHAPSVNQTAAKGAMHTSGAMANRLAHVLIPAAAIGNGRLRDAWRQAREHRRRRGFEAGPKDRSER